MTPAPPNEDIVARLRAAAPVADKHGFRLFRDACTDAAAEIERLAGERGDKP